MGEVTRPRSHSLSMCLWITSASRGALPPFEVWLPPGREGRAKGRSAPLWPLALISCCQGLPHRFHRFRVGSPPPASPQHGRIWAPASFCLGTPGRLSPRIRGLPPPGPQAGRQDLTPGLSWSRSSGSQVGCPPGLPPPSPSCPHPWAGISQPSASRDRSSMASLGWPGLPWGARKEQKSLARAIRALEHLEHALGQDPHLEPSPPSLADLLPQMRGLLRQVAEAQRLAQGGLHEPGGASDFLAGYLSNLAQKGQQLAALFPAGSKAFWEGSSRRRKLTKLSLIFSHMHTELRALFPDGHYCGHTYQLSKPQAQEFWRENCGKRCVVPWEEFEALLSSCHPVKPGPMGQALKSTIDLTVSGHVSVFEFEVFTCLFQVWGARRTLRAQLPGGLGLWDGW
uniref:E3 ubiquitin-protein ligase CBL n=1 Tax=Monodelphis domestica TaxID=13616 RepID=A0A5F8H5R2_MONDO